MAGYLYTSEDGGLLHFVLISVVIGGAMAWSAGRAIASTWRRFWVVPVYMVILACAVRFLHYALGGEELLDPLYFIVSFVIVLIASAYGYRSERARQMTTQYSWLFESSGPLGWHAKT